MTDELSKRLREWAQNEEMINQYFTAHGKDCNEAADALDERGARIAELEKLLGAASCPNKDCDGDGYPVPDNYGGWAKEQCQWCDERRKLIAAAQDESRE